MTSPHLLAASQIDRKLPKLRKAAARLQRSLPTKGWIRALRNALGLSSRGLGLRLSLAQQSIVQLEENERSGAITLASLRRVAEALDAELVYALVPKAGLRATISARALAAATERVGRVPLELDGPTPADTRLRERIEALARELEERPRELWR